MPSQLTTKAIDQSTYLVTAGTFTDESGTAVTPKTFTWTLTNAAGEVINSRSAVSETPAGTVKILLSGNDLKRSDGKSRIVAITYTYDSSLGSDLTSIDTVFFGLELTPYTYDPGTTVGQVRERIGDTDFSSNQCGVKPSGANFTDDEINNALSATGSDVDRAAARLCDTLAIMWAGAGEQITVRGTPVDTTQKAVQYRLMARQLRGSRFGFEVY